MTLRDETWLEHRSRLCMEPGVVYLNTGSYSVLPRPVAEKLADWREHLARAPLDFYWRRVPDTIQEARRAFAGYLGADPLALVFFANVTQALNAAASSLSLPPGSRIAMSDHEYGAMQFMWRELAKRHQWTLDEVRIPVDVAEPEEIVDRFRRVLKPETRALFFSHVTSPSGLVMPAKRLCALARQRGILSLVDGAHAPGMLDLDLAEIGADFYGGNGHKWFMAPVGVGFLHVHESVKATLRPFMTSWGWKFDPERPDDDSGWGASYWARQFEFQGTTDRSPQMVIPEVIAFRDSIGEEAIRRRSRELASHARARLLEVGWSPATSDHPELSGALVTCDVPKVDALRTREWFWNEGRVEMVASSGASRHFVRMSTAWFVTTDEIDQAVELISRCPWHELT
ncbi:Isopenicillin N epimerase [Planctomycetes bacterium Pan216]|uniref:Isopenicillin N epimerase n=1 Tax=Kolteria novifilia TaxID=2527975 RepID=A0A518B208_9BACT|nr:Isopenicillin N epimerase [Planctomycetes bacterium Pan216]